MACFNFELNFVTFSFSALCVSGSLPAMGKTLIFWVLEQRSAMDNVIFLWVALSVECGLQPTNRNTSQFHYREKRR